jgi:hypothetical protein
MLLQAGTLNGSSFWGKATIGLLIRDVLDDGGAFGQDLAVVKAQHRNIALRIDLQEVRISLRFLCLRVDTVKFEFDARFAQNDIG